jgi:serine/threonine-protein kinase RIM15
MVTKNATLIVTIWIGRGTSTVTISTVTQSLFVSPSYTILRILGLLRLILILIVAKSLNKKRSHRSHSRQHALPEDDSTKINIQCLPLPSSISRRSSCILLDGPIDTIITTLCDLIGVATDVADMSTASLTAQPEVCEPLVQQVQTIGKAWDEHLNDSSLFTAH